jgi:hypothetical protein
MIRIEHDAATGEIKEIELSEKEIKEIQKEYAKTKAENDLLQAEAEAKEVARQALLDRLGLTADEAKLLLG